MNLGDKIAAWLRSAPGPIAGDTYDDCILKAFSAFNAYGARETDSFGFAKRLSIAGYAPQDRADFERGGRKWILPLPEKFGHV